MVKAKSGNEMIVTSPAISTVINGASTHQHP
jgi:hypothetical protein